MPFWSSTSTPTGSVWWLSDSFLAWPPWWRMGEMRGSVHSSLNKARDQSDLEVCSLLPVISSCCRGGRGEDEELRARLCRPDKVIRPWSVSSAAIAERCWRSPEFSRFIRGHTPGDRWPASVDLSPLTHMVEGQPSHSSRSENQKGGNGFPARRPQLRPLLRWPGCGELIVPSGAVPGDDALGSGLETVYRIGLQSTIMIWGPLCKVLGRSCNFYLLRGPFVSCAEFDLI